MNPNDTHREQLSALIDGALDADQRRFLLRRLQHDGELTDSLSRWQMVGDVLRGQAEAPAPAGFAEAIATRIADEPLPLIEDGGIDMPVRNASASEVASKAVVARGARWRWFGGGALAASLVIASVLALRPDTSPVASATFATNEAASSTPSAKVEVASGGIVTAAPLTVAAETTPLPASSPTTRVNAAARGPVRVARAAPMPARSASPAPAAERDIETAASRVTLPAESAPRTAQTEPRPAANPFQAPAAKAWPRAVIPRSDNGTFNASFNSDASYYPFAPNGAEPASEE
ncbi:MAG: hypothetical protein IAE66_01120 [Xanthomonadaceae bacterium]|nr:hypothetical protein [Xanthomonadaceae bacterium]